MTTSFIQEFKKAYETIDARLDENAAVHDALYKAFVVPMGDMLDGAEGDGIENDFKGKNGKGNSKGMPMGGGDFIDGAEGGKVKRDLKSKAGSGSSGKVLEGDGDFVDGASTKKIQKK